MNKQKKNPKVESESETITEEERQATPPESEEEESSSSGSDEEESEPSEHNQSQHNSASQKDESPKEGDEEESEDSGDQSSKQLAHSKQQSSSGQKERSQTPQDNESEEEESHSRTSKSKSEIIVQPVAEIESPGKNKPQAITQPERFHQRQGTVNFRDKRYQSFIKLRSDLFKVTSQTSLKSDAVQNPGKKGENKVDTKKGPREEAYKVQDYRIFFGDPQQMAMNMKLPHQNKVRTQRYTALTWAPLSLLYQFKRLANIYFLIISVLTFLSFSPKEPASMIGTFALVLFFTMLKEAYEDYQRYKQDKEVNNKLALVLNPLTMQFESKKWEDIEIGNVVKFVKDNEAPADIAILYSSNQSGVVYVDTMNLDGETNLKEKNSLMENLDERNLINITGELKCDEPHENLDKWDGRIFFKRDNMKPLVCSIKNLLLRGCFVRNTEYGIGIVVYTGMKTKIMKNLKKPPHKVSNIMRLMNKMLYSVFAFQICLIMLFAGLMVGWTEDQGELHPYLDLDTSMDKAQRYFIQLLVFWVAYSHMIPISLYVIIEILKLGTASFINKDLTMYDQETESFARCRNSDLIEELGQVEMVFSDKTGTLTQNKMIFKKAQINGIKYGEPLPQEPDNPDGMIGSGIKDIRKAMRKEIQAVQDEQPQYSYVTEFFQALALCNTVMCERDKKAKETLYKASSPDELALANGAKLAGIKLQKREHDRVTIENLLTQSESTFKVIAEFPFDSVRKRMSVVMKSQDGKYQILCKGADSVMLDRISYEKSPIESLKQIIESDLYTYSCEGLRTLMIAKRSICKEEYDQFKKIYDHLQQSSSSNKEEKLNQLYDAMEQKLRYLGCTAIEDKLQDGVPITISKLLEADIRFFMLTGDKLETAIEIAKSCQVIQDDMAVMILAKPIKEKVYKKLHRIVSILNIDINSPILSLGDVKQERQVITVDGSTLTLILGDDELQELFFHVAIRSKSVVCCRMSPKQKADVVQMFKKRGKWITLAIGDGANDVSMIMEAHIGVGIKGKEGTQAVRSADFAISQFQYLLRLVLLHGRYGYLRVSQMICYYFYKNIILVFTEIYFASYNGFSGQIFFLDWLSVLYNAFFTSWHCLFAYLLERDVNDHYSYKFPSIYKAGQLGLYFNFKIFWKWIVLGVWHGVVCFFAPLFVSQFSNNLIQSGIETSVVQEDGMTGEHWLHSTISFTVVIHLVFYKLLLETTNFNWVTIGFGLLSMLCYYAFLLLAQIPIIGQTFQPAIQGLVQQMVGYPQFWLLLIAAPLACLVPDFFIKLVLKVFYPTPVEIVIMKQKGSPQFDFSKYLVSQDKEEFKRKKSMKEAKNRKNFISEQQMSHNDNYSREEGVVDLQHLAENIPRNERNRKNQVQSSSSSSNRQSSGGDESHNFSGMLHKKDEDDIIDEVDEEEVTDSNDSESSDSDESDSSNESQNEDKSQSNDQDDSGSRKSQSKSQMNQSASYVDQSFRSNRGLLVKEKSIKEVRESRKQKQVSVQEEKKVRQSQSPQKSGTIKSKKSLKKKESVKIQNNSIFSVSDASKSELLDDKNQGKSEYLEYFEDLNKEIIERQNSKVLQLQNSLRPSASKKSSSKQMLTDDKHTDKEEKKSTKKEVSNHQASHKSLQKLKEESITKNLQSISDEESKRKTPLKDDLTQKLEAIQEIKRPQTTNRVDKDFFKKILGNRTQNVFMISTAQEIPKSKITKPHQIVDQIVVSTAVVQDRPVTPSKTPINYMFGHPLESNRPQVKTPRMSQESKEAAPSQKKKKKYVEKYNNGFQIQYQ